MINFSYIVATALFVIGLKFLSSPKTARSGNGLSSIGMLLAIVVTLFDKEILSYEWILAGLVIGTFLGLLLAKKVLMTQMPEMVALLNGFGGLASLLVGWNAAIVGTTFYPVLSLSIYLSILIGGVTFTGSVIAWAKLAEKMPSKPIIFSGQKLLNLSLFTILIFIGIYFTFEPKSTVLLTLSILASLVLGVLSVIPIGGADMPVVISLLNSYSGLAACATGFVIQNTVLIVSGVLVGASGIILSSIMCKAMNRSLIHVLFSGFGGAKMIKKEEGEARSISPKDAYFVLEAAKNVLIVPGYGLAVAQAQHVVKELIDLLEENGAEVKFAIHPVAGRMPGHMNVLLAEADISYDHFIEMEEANHLMPSIDVCLIIGANDVVNPSAKDLGSPIFGMPIIEANLAKNVFIFKRSMASGFAGIPNPLFYKENSSMIFGDAKKSLQIIIDAF